MKPLMINNTDRNIINSDSYEFYFKTLLASKGIKLWNDFLTKKEMVKARWLRFVSTSIRIIGSAIMMYIYLNADTTTGTACLMVAGTSTMLKRTNTLVNGYSYSKGNDNNNDNGNDNVNDNVNDNNNGTPSIFQYYNDIICFCK